MADTKLPAGVPELSGDEAIDMGRHLDPVSAAYALGARRGYEAVLTAADAAQGGEAVPYCYVYEYDSPLGLHRALYPKQWNGWQPTRTVAVYTHPAQAPAVPEGYARVPVEPTPEMVEAGRGNFEKWGSVQRGWAAMLAAAPPAQAQPGFMMMPTSADEAQAMANLGIAWLKEHAPDRLKEPAQAQQAPTDAEIDALMPPPRVSHLFEWKGLAAAGEIRAGCLTMEQVRATVRAALAAFGAGGGV